jgi:hypothetical protein
LTEYLRYTYYRYISEHWNIGFALTPLQDILKGNSLNIQWHKHSYKDRWFADPFILDITEKDYIVLVEEFLLKEKKGRIAKLIIDKKKLEIVRIENILEQKTHLSFPNVIMYKDSVYILPENTGSKRTVLYSFNTESNAIEPLSVLFNDPLADPVIVPVSNQYYLLATRFPCYSGKVLSIYVSDSLCGPYVFKHTIYFVDSIARNAGAVFQVDGKWIRPTQICNKTYGEGVALQEIVFKSDIGNNVNLTSNEEYSFNELRRLYPVDEKYNLGMHTFNFYKNVVAIDGKYYVNPFIRKIMVSLHSLIKAAVEAVR